MAINLKDVIADGNLFQRDGDDIADIDPDDILAPLPSLENGTEVTFTLAGSPPSETLTPVVSPTRFSRIISRAGVGLTASSTATSILASTIVPAANSIAVGDLLQFHTFGLVLNNVGSTQTLTLRLRCGAGNLMAGGALSLTTSATPRAWVFDVECLVTATSGGTLYGVQGRQWVSDFVSDSAPAITRYYTGTDNVVDLTNWASDAFDLTAQHNTTSGSMTTGCNGLILTHVRP